MPPRHSQQLVCGLNILFLSLKFKEVQKSISMLVTSVPWEDVSISGSLWDDLVSHLRFALQSRRHSELDWTDESLL